jgi:hypothetical protein
MFKAWLESKTISPDEARTVLKGAKRKPVTIKFVKKDGETRTMRGMYGVKPKNPSGTGMTYDPESRGMVLMNDRDVASKHGVDAAFRSVTLASITTISTPEGETYDVARNESGGAPQVNNES